MRHKWHKGTPKIALGLNLGAHRYAQIKHEQCHRNGKDAIAEGSEALPALSSDRMVIGRHQLSPHKSAPHEPPKCTRIRMVLRHIGATIAVICNRTRLRSRTHM